MESLIPIFNRVRELSKALGDDVFRQPRIVMVGCQGSGKSSVLESLVGRSFLPKGTGVVTRTPLVLHLVNSPQQPGPQRRPEDGTLDAEEYGVFMHTDAIFTDFDEICREIQRQTEKIAGNNKGIGEEEITLKLYSPRLADVTLVDLPGLTKLPVGDQPPDVETRIRNLVLKYIDNTDTIIMAVLTANNDMATNESLKLAKDVDPEGSRTLAVLTKVDLMDAGTDATDILLGRVIPVKLGIVAVINRSQKDIDDKKPITLVSKQESQFLRKKYPSLADRNGTPFLVATLKKLLMELIKDYLLDVKRRVKLRIPNAEALVDFYSDDEEEKDRGLLKIIREFSSTYSEEIRASAENLRINKGEGGPRIFKILHETFKTELNDVSPRSEGQRILRAVLDNRDKLSAQTTLLELLGPDNERLIVPSLSCDQLVYDEVVDKSCAETILLRLLEPDIERLLIVPSLRCAHLVYDEMVLLLTKRASVRESLAQKFSFLNESIQNLLKNLLMSKNRLVNNVIRHETFYNLTQRIIYIRRFDKTSELLNMEEFENESEVEKKCDIIVKFQNSYFETARRIVHDDVTKAVMQYMVNEVRNYLHDGLVRYFRYPGAGRIFQVDRDVAEKRTQEIKALERLYEARKILDNFHVIVNIVFGDSNQQVKEQ